MSNSVKTPVCLGGKRRCPPDGVGGVSGYQEFLKFIVDPAHRNDEPFIHYAGGLFRAEEFNLTTVNIILSRMPWHTRKRHWIVMRGSIRIQPHSPGRQFRSSAFHPGYSARLNQSRRVKQNSEM